MCVLSCIYNWRFQEAFLTHLYSNYKNVTKKIPGRIWPVARCDPYLVQHELLFYPFGGVLEEDIFFLSRISHCNQIVTGHGKRFKYKNHNYDLTTGILQLSLIFELQNSFFQNCEGNLSHVVLIQGKVNNRGLVEEGAETLGGKCCFNFPMRPCISLGRRSISK